MRNKMVLIEEDEYRTYTGYSLKFLLGFIPYWDVQWTYKFKGQKLLGGFHCKNSSYVPPEDVVK